MDTSTKYQVECGVYCENFVMIGLTADAGDTFKKRASIPLAPCICFLSLRSSWKQPGQYIHAKPFSHEDYPNYDMDEEDLRFIFFYICSVRNIE
jgi:hypothetical protein